MGLSRRPASLAVCSCQRATDLPLLATLRRRAIAASLRPLGVHEYALGSQSCDAGLACVRLLVVFRQIGRACHLWRCSSSASGVESRSRSSVSGSRRSRGDPRRRGLPWLRSGFARLAPRLRHRRSAPRPSHSARHLRRPFPPHSVFLFCVRFSVERPQGGDRSGSRRTSTSADRQPLWRRGWAGCVGLMME